MPAATPVVAPVETVTPDPIQKIFLENRKERGKLRLPTVINAEDRFTDPSEIPAAILKFIEQIPDVHEDCKVSVQSINDCFAVVQVDLNEDSFADFILFGRGRNGGANIAPFWVLAGTQNGFSLVLQDAKLQLEIQRKKNQGYFDIVAEAVVAGNLFTEYYSFDLNSYKSNRTVKSKL